MIYPINDFTGKLSYHNASTNTNTAASSLHTKKGSRDVVVDVSWVTGMFLEYHMLLTTCLGTIYNNDGTIPLLPPPSF